MIAEDTSLSMGDYTKNLRAFSQLNFFVQLERRRECQAVEPNNAAKIPVGRVYSSKMQTLKILDSRGASLTFSPLLQSNEFMLPSSV